MTWIEYKFDTIGHEVSREHHIAFRVNADGADKDKLIRYLHQYKKFFMVSENESTNHHYQGYFLAESPRNIKTRTYKDSYAVKSLKETFPHFVGNKHFSMKCCDNDIDKYLTYLCKGNSIRDEPCIIKNNILIGEESTHRHKAYWEKNKKLKSNTGHKKRDKIMNYDLPDKYHMLSEKQKIGMKIILWNDENGTLLPCDNHLVKMIDTFHFAQSKDKPSRALMLVNHALKQFT